MDVLDEFVRDGSDVDSICQTTLAFKFNARDGSVTTCRVRLLSRGMESAGQPF